jgi:Rrf2 family transcriptional regulator, nitric oxide-sensitive transcriptional repressor
VLSQTVEYALRAAVYLAGEGQPRTAAEISSVTRVPTAYLAKVLQQLARARVVHGQRGPNGGFALSRAADKLTLWEVVQALEPMRRIRECPLDLKTHKGRLCPLHRKLDDAIAEMERSFRSTTLAELIGDPESPRPLCDIPASPVPKGRVVLH